MFVSMMVFFLIVIILGMGDLIVEFSKNIKRAVDVWRSDGEP